MNEEFIKLLGKPIKIKTPEKPEDKLTKNGKIRVKAPQYCVTPEYDQYFENLEWGQTYDGYIYEDDIYIQHQYGLGLYRKNQINPEYIMNIFSTLFVDDNLRNVLCKLNDRIQQLEDRLDRI